MKRVLFILWFLSSFAVSAVLAATTLTLGNAAVYPGDTAQIKLTLNNTAVIGGFQFVITPLPSGTVTFSGVETVGRAIGWTASTNSVEDGIILLAYSPSGASIAPGNDSILVLSFLVSPQAAKGTITLEISGVLVSNDIFSPVTDLTVTNGSIIVGQAANPSQNQQPIASFSCLVKGSDVILKVEFDASTSSDADGSIAAYNWDFGDGFSAEGVKVSHTFQNAGAYNVTLTVTDNMKTSGTLSKTIILFQIQNAGSPKGDINDDGKIDIMDLLQLLSLISGNK